MRWKYNCYLRKLSVVHVMHLKGCDSNFEVNYLKDATQLLVTGIIVFLVHFILCKV